MKVRTLKNHRLGITEDDIRECDNPEQLIEWKLEIGKDLMELSSQINAAKAKASEGNYSDPVWFANVHGAKKCQGMLDQMIAFRLRTLRTTKREEDDAKEEDRLRTFLEVASEELPEKLFKTLLRKAENRVKKTEKEKSTTKQSSLS